jgi:hypothetical protein
VFYFFPLKHISALGGCMIKAKDCSRKIQALLIALAFTLLCINLALGAPEVRHYGPFPSTSPDSGTCGNDWAEDSFDRHFRVNTSPGPNGTFTVTEEFKNGTFVTNAGPSPGGCDTNPGGTVAAGVTGKLEGSFVIVVSGGTFDRNATCPSGCTTAGFITAVFGSSATYDIPTFLFHYSTGHNGEWKNASADRGGNHGDITGAP